MKKAIIFLLLVSGCITTSIAQSMLKVRLTDNSRFNVSVDGRYFNKTGTSVTVGDLPYGRHSLKIFQFVENRRGRMYEEVIYEGSVKTYRDMITLLVFDKYSGQTDINEQEIREYTYNHPPANGERIPDQYNNGGQNNNNGNRYDNNYNNNGNNGGNNNAYNNGYNNNNNDNNYNNNSAPVATPITEANLGTMTVDKMNDLKTKVLAKPADTDKMNILKDALKNEKITTSEIAEMFDWFTFESAKVDFAKWAYSYTVDKEYYTDLENKLSYKNYQDDLDKFIKDNK